MKLLHIDSSPLGGNSVSRQLTERIVAQWRATHPGTVVEYLDLAADAPSHLSIDSLGFRAGPNAEGLSDVQRRENAISEQLVSQFLAADVIVVGAPMYNFSIPSQLKAWIDRVAQAGRTFTYTEKGPKGLAGGKTVIVASTRGGVYSTNPALAGPGPPGKLPEDGVRLLRHHRRAVRARRRRGDGRRGQGASPERRRPGDQGAVAAGREPSRGRTGRLISHFRTAGCGR